MPEMTENIVGMTRLTNGQCRPTYVKKQKEAGVEDRLIANTTGHIYLETLKNYDTEISNERQIRQSNNIINPALGTINNENSNVQRIVKETLTAITGQPNFASKGPISSTVTTPQIVNPQKKVWLFFLFYLFISFLFLYLNL